MAEENTQLLAKKHHFQVYKRYPVTLVKGSGAIVYDDEGNEYIDALAGIAVNGTGHNHPKVAAAIKDQADQLLHCSNLYYNEPQSKLAKRLTELSGLERAFFCNSGAEAVEAALKLARRYGDKHGKTGPVYSFTNCFHGRTIATIALGKTKYQDGFGPMPEGLKQLPFNEIEPLRQNIDKNTKAVIVEPIQGEGGIVPAKKEFLQALREICTENDVLLIFDEIQCGMGRTGKLFAYEYFGVKPDVITIAKALGGGFPIGAMLATEKASEAFEFGIHGTTFGGNPLACSAANAVLDVIEEEQLLKQVEEKGRYFTDNIKEKTKDIKSVKEIRGAGLMLGIELDFKCSDVVAKMLQKGVLANCAAEYVIRLLPPYVISNDEIDKVIEVMTETIRETENG